MSADGVGGVFVLVKPWGVMREGVPLPTCWSSISAVYVTRLLPRDEILSNISALRSTGVIG